jgi:hypothetical protein
MQTSDRIAKAIRITVSRKHSGLHRSLDHLASVQSLAPTPVSWSSRSSLQPERRRSLQRGVRSPEARARANRGDQRA